MPATLVSSDSTMKILKMSDEHSDSNPLPERQVREVEDQKIQVAAIRSTMTP
jgi:hypothetical protein